MTSRLRLAFWFPAALVVAGALLTLLAVRQGMAARHAEALSTARIAQVDSQLSTVYEVMAAMRGYLLTGGEYLLEPYLALPAGGAPGSVELEAAFADDPESRKHVIAMRQLFAQWRTEVAEPSIAARREAPIPLVRAGAGLEEALDLGIGAEEVAAKGEALGKAAVLIAEVLDDTLPGDLRPSWAAALDEVVAARQKCGSEARLVDCEAAYRPAAAAVRRLVRDARERDRQVTDTGRLDRGRALADAIRTEARTLEDREATRRATLEAETREATTRAEVLVLVFLPLALVAAFTLSARRGAALEKSAAEVARASLALAAGDLSARPPTDGPPELRPVSDSFALMAERLGRRERETTLLREMANLLQSARTLEEAYEVSVAAVEELAPGTRVRLLVVNASRNLLEPVDGRADGEPHPPDACWALRRGIFHLDTADRGGRTCQHVASDKAALCVPLTAHGDALGVLTLEAPRDDGRRVLEGAVAVATTAGEQIALAIGNLRLRETLRQQAFRDLLTGLYNRRFLDEVLEREIARAVRKKTSVAVLLCDIDFFKRFNDTHGHDAGDAVLRAVADVLRRGVRATDLACRYGGEELAVVLLDADEDGARLRAEALREACEKLRVDHEGRTLGPVTMSIGVALAPLHGADPKTVVKAADVALYAAKQAGRNRVCLAARPLA